MSKKAYVESVTEEHPASVHPSRRRSAQDDYLDDLGREKPDPTPLAPPVGHNRQPSLAEQIRSMVVSERLKQEAVAAGYESFEEADDFDVGDDYDPTSPYEEVFDPPEDPYARLEEAFRRGTTPPSAPEPAPAPAPPAPVPADS